VYGNRSYARFYVLETIARVPYFSYLSVLHLYETLGFWRGADLLKVHFAETWNELHHLLIMESLDGNRYWVDRLTAHLIACGLLLDRCTALYGVSSLRLLSNGAD
jgi:ubiquinol oxidase